MPVFKRQFDKLFFDNVIFQNLACMLLNKWISVLDFIYKTVKYLTKEYLGFEDGDGNFQIFRVPHKGRYSVNIVSEYLFILVLFVRSFKDGRTMICETTT